MTDSLANELVRRGLHPDALAEHDRQLVELAAQLARLVIDLNRLQITMLLRVDSATPGVELAWETMTAPYWSDSPRTRWGLRLRTPWRAPRERWMSESHDPGVMGVSVFPPPADQASEDPPWEWVYGERALLPYVAELVPALLDRLAELLAATDRTARALQARQTVEPAAAPPARLP